MCRQKYYNNLLILLLAMCVFTCLEVVQDCEYFRKRGKGTRSIGLSPKSTLEMVIVIGTTV